MTDGNKHPYNQPSEAVRKHAFIIAGLEMSRKRLRIKEVLQRDFEARPDFTMICHGCGSMNVGMIEVSRDGEWIGTELKCRNCGNRQ